MSERGNGPPDPITVLMAGAVQMHELYLAFMKAGFTEDQALRLVIAVIHKPSS
jgi:hypothetical protein